MCFFLLKKTSQPRKKLKFCMKKWQKNDKKRYQKEHPAPQNLIFCMKKKFFFYSKRSPTLAKNWIFAWKYDKKLTKKGTKKSTQPRKNWSFAWKKLSFFTQKYHPAPQKTDFFNEKMTKNWQPPTSQNVLTHNKIFLHFFTHIAI